MSCKGSTRDGNTDLDKDVVDGLRVKDVYCSPESERVVFDQPTHDVTDSGSPAARKSCVRKRLNTQDSIQLDESCFSSPIFVRHPNQDQDLGDPLGGFLCTASLQSEIYVHAFCTLDDRGILAKCLQVREKDILVSLDSREILDSESLTHEEVLELFAKLPLGRPINMVVYDRKSEEFTRIEFQLEGVTGASAETNDIMVKKESVKLMADPPTVDAFQFPNEPKFLVNRNGQLIFNQVENFRRDCSCHFIVNKKLDTDHWYTVYRYQAQKDKTKFLGIKGNTLGLVDGSANKKYTLFRQERNIGHETLLKPCTQEDKVVHYNKKNGKFELVKREDALNDPVHGIRIVPTSCKP